MKFCVTCGKQLADGAKFCPYCGGKQPGAAAPAAPADSASAAPATPAAAPAQPAAQPTPQGAPAFKGPAFNLPPVPGGAGTTGPAAPQWNGAAPAGAPGAVGVATAPKAPLTTKQIGMIAVAAVAALLVIIIGGILISNGKKTINLNDYVTVTYKGYDGSGYASVEYDEDALMLALNKATGKKSSNSSTTDQLLEDWSSLGLYFTAFGDTDVKVTPNQKLSNGDKVTIEYKLDEDAAKAAGIKLKGKDTTETVKGLEELDECDPFADVIVSFDGCAPFLSVKISNNNSDHYYSYDYTPKDNLKVGDSVTVTLTDSSISSLNNEGFKPSRTSAEYPVENVNAYVTNCAGLTDTVMTLLKKDAQDKIEATFADAVSEGSLSYSAPEYKGAYVLLSKENAYNKGNYVTLVYTTTMTNTVDEPEFTPTVVYEALTFQNIYSDPAGTPHYEKLSISSDNSLQYRADWWTNSVTGYTSDATMYSDVVSKRLDEYSVDSNYTVGG